MATKTKSVLPSRKARHAAKEAERERTRVVAELAQKYLDRRAPKSYRINVVPEAIELRGETWCIVAEADRADAPYSDYINRITDASIDMEDGEQMSVMILPVLPPEDD